MRLAREEIFGRMLVAALVLVSAAGLWPELSITRADVNDNIAHFAMLDGMVQAVEQGESPIDFWSTDVAFGYPIFRTYQPLAHGLVALLYFALGKAVPLMTLFVWARFLSVVLIPVTFYKAARLLELPPLTCAAAALLSPLISTIGGGLFGLEYRSYLWIGFGLFPQAVAAHLLLLALGFGYQAIRRGRRMVAAGILLGLACLAHLIYGYIGAVTLCLLAILPDAVIPRRPRIVRTLRVGAIALALAAFQLLPLVLDHAIINHSRYEPATKWNSFGAGQVLQWLFAGELFDHFRLPVFSLLLGAGGVLVAARYWRTRRYQPAETFAFAGAMFWLVVFFGRPTWGPLLYLIGISPDMHLHRVIAGFQIFAILLAAIALAALWNRLGRRSMAAACAASAVLLLPAFVERAHLMRDNAHQGGQNLAAVAPARATIDAVVTLLHQRGGRAFAGLSSTWGKEFRIGYVPFYAFLDIGHVPAVSFMYHNLALPSDIMMRFDESHPDYWRLFNIRTAVIPQGVEPAAFLAPLANIGPLRIFDAPGAGYFDVVDVPAAVTADRDTFYEIADGWIDSGWMHYRQHLLLDFFGNAPPGLERLPPIAPLPPSPAPAQPAGAVRGERQTGQVYEADLDAARPAWALFRMTWHPNWKVWVDGRPAATAMLSPGFLGVPIMRGTHQIVCRYQPSAWRWIVLAAGIAIAVTAANTRYMSQS